MPSVSLVDEFNTTVTPLTGFDVSASFVVISTLPPSVGVTVGLTVGETVGEEVGVTSPRASVSAGTSSTSGYDGLL